MSGSNRSGTTMRRLALCAVAVVVGMLVLGVGPATADAAQLPVAAEGLSEFTNKIEDLKGPALTALAALAGLGLLLGGGLLALGQQNGPKVMALSGGSLAAVALGDGVVKILAGVVTPTPLW